MGQLFGISSDNYGRGTWFKTPIDTRGSQGCRLIGSGQFGGEEPLLVTSFDFSKKELTTIVKCFNDVSYLYAFGDDIASSMLSVTAVGFLTSCEAEQGGSSGLSVTLSQSFYNSNRIFEQPTAPIDFYYGNANKTLKGYLVGINSSTNSPEIRLQTFTLSLILVDFIGTEKSGSGSSSGDSGSGSSGIFGAKVNLRSTSSSSMPKDKYSTFVAGQGGKGKGSYEASSDARAAGSYESWKAKQQSQ